MKRELNSGKELTKIEKSVFINRWLSLSIILYILTTVVYGDYKIEIKEKNKVVKFGDPFYINVIIKYDKPLISNITNNPSPSTQLDALRINITNKNNNQTKIFTLGLPVWFQLNDNLGIEYINSMEVFCKIYKERGRLIKEMVFDESGSYLIKIVRQDYDKINESNSLDVEVEPSQEGKQALSILNDANDLAYLVYGLGLDKNPKRLSVLEEMVDKCPNSLLAKWSSARLGLEYFNQLQKKYPDLKQFKEERDKGNIKEPLFDNAEKHLNEAYKLPDNFQIKEEVIFNLQIIESIKGNQKKKEQLTEELINKYPKGQFSQMIIRGKELSNQFKQVQQQKMTDSNNNKK